MQLKITLSFIAILLCFQLYAQYPCVNGISTNPANPINTQLPQKKNTFYNWESEYWKQKPLINQGNCSRPDSATSPFFRIDNLEDLRVSKDMKWEDGWELIARRVGLFDNNLPRVDPDPDITVILYNKYTGIMRVLMRTCRGQDYNAAQINIQFDPTSNMKTDLLEFSRGSLTPLIKQFGATAFSSGAVYRNNDSKWFYADFPMMYDPCTCLYKSKIYAFAKLISNATINIEGGITGDIYSKDVSGKAEIQKSGSYNWKNFSGTVNGKISTVHGSIQQFASKTSDFASIFSRTDTSGNRNAIGNLANFLSNNKFLKAGFSSVPYLQSALKVVDAFIGGGKTEAGPQEVKVMPMTLNLTAKLSGTISTVNLYNEVIFTNPGSKDAQLDTAIYPYYNEVLGVFNIIDTPVLYKQVNSVIYTSQTGESVRVNENRFKLDLNTIKYILNPAAGVTIQNMRASVLIAGTNRNMLGCQGAPFRIIPPDFTFEGLDAGSNMERFSSPALDMNCLSQRILQANSFFNSIGGQYPTDNVGCARVDNNAWIKFFLNLRRNNTTSNTQNVLYVVTFPLKVVNYNITGNFTDNPSCTDSSIIQPASNSEITTRCNSSAYLTTTRLSRAYFDSIRFERAVIENGFAISPNPNNGQFILKINKQVNQLKMIRIIDVSGRTIYNQNTGQVLLNEGFQRNISLKAPNGTYILIIYTNDKILKKKFIISN